MPLLLLIIILVLLFGGGSIPLLAAGNSLGVLLLIIAVLILFGGGGYWGRGLDRRLSVSGNGWVPQVAVIPMGRVAQLLGADLDGLQANLFAQE